MNRKKLILSLVMGIGVSIFFFAMLFSGMRKEDKNFFLVWEQMTLWPAMIATLLYLVGHGLRGVRCAMILRPYQKISVWHATQLVWIGYAANNILPFRLGEFFRAYVLTQKEKVEYGISLSTLFIERILDGLAIFVILFVVSSFAKYNVYVENLSWFAGSLFLGASFVILFARIWKALFIRWVSFVCRFLPTNIGQKVESFGHKLLDGTECLQWNRRLPAILFLSLLVWIVEGCMFLFMLVAFHFPMSWIAAYFSMTITNLGVLLPSAPSGMGVFHYFCTKGLMISGVISSLTAGLSYAIAIHLLQIIPVTLLGIWSLYSYGFDIKTMLSAKQASETE